jgi:hypothetical protein
MVIGLKNGLLIKTMEGKRWKIVQIIWIELPALFAGKGMKKRADFVFTVEEGFLGKNPGFGTDIFSAGA